MTKKIHDQLNRIAIKTLLIFVFCFGFFSSSKANDVYFHHLGVKDGLTQISIFSFYQDEIGAMWFGSFEGLNRYNGREITAFRPSQNNKGLTQNEIYSICGNKKGAIYLRAGHDLVKYNVSTQQFTCLAQKEINGICYSNDTLWVISDHAIFYYLEGKEGLHKFCDIDPGLGNGSCIFTADNEYLWVGTENNLLSIPFSAPDSPKVVLSGVFVKYLYKSKRNDLWVSTDASGAYRISSQNQITNFRYSPGKNGISDDHVRSVVEDEFGNIWIGTFYGLNKYDPITDKWKCYTQIDNVPYSLSHSSVFGLYRDLQGNIWVGTYFGGINHFNPRADIYHFYGAIGRNNPNYLSFPFVGKMAEDKNGNLWICTEGGGLNFFNRQTKQFKSFMQEDNPRSISHNNLKCIKYLKDKDLLYIGTHTGGLNIFDIKSQTVKVLKNNPGEPASLPNDIVNDIQFYKDKLIVLTQAGVCSMDLKSETFSSLSANEVINRAVERKFYYETFLIDSKDRMWIAKSDGGVVRIDLNNNKIKEYNAVMEDSTSIGKFRITHILEDSKGKLFFGTLGSGLFLYLPETDTFRNFTAEKGDLQSNYCYYIAESPYDHLMVLHNKGVSFFDPETRTLKHVCGIPQMSFNQGSSVCSTKDGEVFFGGIDGLTSLYEQLLYTTKKEYQLYFDKLWISNREVRPGDGSGILSSALSNYKEIELDYNKNNLFIEFATSNYVSNNDFQYEYKLVGLDDTWLPAHSTTISYTNLSPGKYRLFVREVWEDAKTETKQIELGIKINPPFYATVWAYLLYALLVVGILYAIFRFNVRQAKLKASLEYERKEKEYIEELNQTKLRFFTNISHEFRTLLTLIIVQVELLLQLNKLNPSVYNRVLKIYKNARHMRDLVSELLDFRKQEQGFLKLKVEYMDIVSFTKEIYMSFYEYALKHSVNYKFEHMEEKLNLWFDPVQLQKVIFNLLSNAFKYTKAKGSITVSIRKIKNEVEIRVEDDGVGISKESIHKIFDRFYQVDGQSSEFTLGTGIGLAVSKGIVELHKGNIRVESEVGQGSVFIVTLLTGNEHFPKEVLSDSESNFHLIKDGVLEDLALEELMLEEPAKEQELTNEEKAGEMDIESKDSDNKPSILIVEDNLEILEMLEDIFAPIYHVYKATNGKEGFEATRELHPDIVLSDVMMPEMSGKEMCHKIKNSLDVSHIPVVLLTAQTSVEYTVEGYMFGADDYVTKPFNIKVLVSRCNNLVRTRRMLLERFNHVSKTPVVSNAINEQDQELIDRATAIIRKYFEDIEFDMNVLAAELGIGRSKLYLRIKEITGLTPNELTLKIKLEEAMYLITNQPNLNVSEISYQLGFSSPRYFSKCFKSFYGVSPQNCRKGKNKSEESEED